MRCSCEAALSFLRVLRTLHLIRQPFGLPPSPPGEGFAENEKKKAVAIAEAEWLKTRPRMQSGQYSSMTKEQIMGITDPSERVKAIASNQHLF